MKSFKLKYLIIFFLVLGCSKEDNSKYLDQIADLQSQNSKLRQDIATLQAEVNTIPGITSEFQNEIQTLTNEIVNLSNQLSQIPTLEAQLSNAETTISGLEAQLSNAETTISGLQANNSVLQANYTNALANYNLSQSQLQDITQQLSEATENYQSSLITIEELEAEYAFAQSELNKIKTSAVFTSREIQRFFAFITENAPTGDKREFFTGIIRSTYDITGSTVDSQGNPAYWEKSLKHFFDYRNINRQDVSDDFNPLVFVPYKNIDTNSELAFYPRLEILPYDTEFQCFNYGPELGEWDTDYTGDSDWGNTYIRDVYFGVDERNGTGVFRGGILRVVSLDVKGSTLGLDNYEYLNIFTRYTYYNNEYSEDSNSDVNGLLAIEQLIFEKDGDLLIYSPLQEVGYADSFESSLSETCDPTYYN